MTIDGRKIAQNILDDLKNKVTNLRAKGIIPHLQIITLTTDEASRAYVSQKKIKGEEIGAEITVENINPQITTPQLLDRVNILNIDPKVHGIIIQRPLPSLIDEEKIASSISPEKDVDGFHPNSEFTPPVAMAVLKLLEEVYNSNFKFKISNFHDFLGNRKIAVVGRGVTAGGPIISTFKKLGIEPEIITSKTENRDKNLKNSDIIISAVGKPHIIKREDIKKRVILIGVGMLKDENGKFRSDYDEEEIKDKASFYTPIPGGVGPVNVAMLLSNLIKSAENLG